MPDIVTATKVISMSDWEGIYVDGNLEYQNNKAEFVDVELKGQKAIGNIETKEVDMSKLGISSLPNEISDLMDRVEFCEGVVENKEIWEEKIRKAVRSFSRPLSSDEIISEMGITEEEFDVIKGCFMPDSVFNNNTALGEKAILAKAEDNGQLKSKYTLMPNDDARSYK